MFSDLKKYLLSKQEQSYLAWAFPKSKSMLVNGLIFFLITFTALSLVDYFYYAEAHYNSLNPPIPKPFGTDSYFRLIFAPLLNIGIILLARSQWCNSMKRTEWIAGIVIFATLFTFLGTSFSQPYYSADDYTFDVLVLIIFTQTLLGLNFRSSFLFNFLLVLPTISYIWLDDLEIKIQMYNTTIVLLFWLPVSFGAFVLEKSRILNFQTIHQLKDSNLELANTHKKVAQQKKLLRLGEEVSQLGSWKTSKDLKQVSYSHGMHAIYELKKEYKYTQVFLKDVLQLIHPEDKKRFSANLSKLQNGESYDKTTDHRILMPDGRIKWLRNTIGEDKKGKGLFGTVQDITKSKSLELALQQTLKELKIKNEDLQQFAYASSHDLQEPLRTISNFVNILNKKLPDRLDSEEQLYMDIIQQSTVRMRALILAILDYSRIGRNKKLALIDSNLIGQNVLTDLNFAIHESGGTVTIDPLPFIVGYPAEFSMLLQNLISNGLKFRHKGIPPIIKVYCQPTVNHYYFSVKDNGIGIPKKYQHKIFKLFSRLHSKDAYQGTGIGLTHSKKIVELHHGEIWVESSENEGTTFHFTISKSLKIDSNEKKAKIELHHAN